MIEISIPFSKSMINRHNILASYDHVEQMLQQLDSSDVTTLFHCLGNLDLGSYELLDGGTSYRFLLARLSRVPGRHIIVADQKLMSRPHQPLIGAIKDLGVDVRVEGCKTIIEGAGWRRYTVQVDCRYSSQYISALLLNSLRLEEEVCFELINLEHSLSYLKLTIEMMRRSGIDVLFEGSSVRIPAGQSVKSLPVCEIDVSSAFSIAALGAISGPVKIVQFPKESLQPDIGFLDIFNKLKIDYNRTDSYLEIFPWKNTGHEISESHSMVIDLCQMPDLFPVLACLCSIKTGQKFEFVGIGNLVHKESNRIKSVYDLLSSLGVDVEMQTDRFIIHSGVKIKQSVLFDTRGDHRMAMAAAVLKAAGSKIEVTTPDTVEKSYRNFWQDFTSITGGKF